MTDDTKAENRGPSRWDGSEESWQEWRFEFINWSRRHDPKCPEMLKHTAECDVDEVKTANMDADARILAGKVMTDLALKTTGAAKRLIMTTEETENGFLAFRDLARRAEAGSGLKGNNVTYGDSQLEPSQQGLSDAVRISVVTSGVTGDLRKQLLARTTSFASYSSMRKFILDYLDAQRVYSGPNSAAQNKKKVGDDPMEIDALQWQWSWKGSKGK
eukprot:6463670-Amphidinium_carterae.1